MTKIAIVEKCPSKVDYNNIFSFDDYDRFFLSSTYKPKVLKKDIDIDIDTEAYDYIIAVGAEALKYLVKSKASVVSHQGLLLEDKVIPLVNPSMVRIRPENRPSFDKAVRDIENIVVGLNTTPKDVKIVGITDEEVAYQYLRKILLEANGYVAMDTETSALYPRDGYILGISIAYKEDEGAYIDSEVISERVVDLLQTIADRNIIVYHNSKFDISMLQYHFGLKLDKTYSMFEDTMLLHYILDENGSHGLKDLAIQYTDLGDYDVELDTYKRKYCKEHGVLLSDFTYDLIPFGIMVDYAALDTVATLRLFNIFKPRVEEQKQLSAVNRLLKKGTIFLNKVENNGVPFEKTRLLEAQKTLNDDIFNLEEQIYNFNEVIAFENTTKKKFNPNSVMQLRDLLFNYVGLTPTGAKTATGADSLDANALAELAEKHPLPALLLKIRQTKKIKSTYIDKILINLDIDARLRTGFHLHTTTSGRLSSSGKLNMQQLPRDNKVVKACIKAREGYVIVSQDLATAEMYIVAVLAKDKALQQVFKDVQSGKGADFHSTIAHMVFKLPCDPKEVKKLYPTERQAAKAVSFGILYGSGPAKVSETVTNESGKYFSIDDAKDTIKQYFDTFFMLKRWLKNNQDFIKQNLYTQSIFGRKRRLPNVASSDKSIQGHEIRSGINFLVQSVASDVNLIAGIHVQERIEELGLDVEIFGLVHDSILAEVKIEDLERYAEELKKATQMDMGVSIPDCPIGIDIEIGEDYSFKEPLRLTDGKLVPISKEIK